VSIGLRSGRITISRKGDLHHEALLINTSQINVIGNGQLTAQLIRECFRRSIPILWFTYGGWFCGIAEGLPAKNVELRRRQATIPTAESSRIAAQMIEGKILNCRTLLRRNERETNDDTFAALKRLAASAAATDNTASLLGVEGAAARLYFAAFTTMLRNEQPFDFTHRNRRPPTDPVNSLLSFLYALLVKDLTAIAFGIGLDPYQGVYHRPRFGRPALALDLAEEFRPLIADSVAVTMLNTNEIRPTDFIHRGNAVALTDAGRKTVIAAYERRLDTEITHPLFGYKATYRRILETQARLFAAHLVGEIDRYHPFRTR
jgi:CRISPR-associated protein Cas1